MNEYIAHIQLPPKHVGDTLEFNIDINVDMTDAISPTNPGGLIVKDDDSIAIPASYTVIDASTGKFYIYFVTTGATPGLYKVQLWWSYNDSLGPHHVSTPVFLQTLNARLAGMP